MSDVSITVIPDGPMKVSGARSLAYAGELLPTPEGDVYLCRCGESKNAPFCDGSHKTTGFVGSSEPRTARPVAVWGGRTIRTRFNPNTCMHAYYCKPLNALREADLAGDDSAAAEIARVVGTCPSGALSYEAISPLSVVDPEAGPQIDIQAGGEVRVQCAFVINAERPEAQADDRATLCRCGLSKSKPWCDGRHSKRDAFR